MAATPLHGRKQDGRGQHNVVPLADFRKQALLAWLCTPLKERNPTSQVELADQLGVERKTLYSWRQDKEFLEEWERRYLATIGDPSRKSEIMDTLYRTATDPDDPKHVQAAKQYFEIEGSVKPARMELKVTGSPKELTDEQLADIIALKATSELEHRRSS
jgi:hypothetical protein